MWVRASMGPRPCGRGNRRGAPVLADGQKRFNGAAPLRARKRCSFRTVSRLSPCFNGAAPLRARKRFIEDAIDLHGGASMGPRPCGRGNGGHVSQKLRHAYASMGPRPCGRGNCLRSAIRCARRALQWGRALAGAETRPPGPRMCLPRCSFNGAAPLRARKHAYRIRSTPNQGSFNGAAPLRARKPEEAELLLAHRTVASMGPRPCGRGNRQGVRPYQSGHLPASMGPRPCGRGNSIRVGEDGAVHAELQWGRALAGAETTAIKLIMPMLVALQWGRALAGAETIPYFRHFCLDIAASMGPRPCGRGNAANDLRRRLAPVASMGPRPCGRGNRILVCLACTIPCLASMGPRPCGRGNSSPSSCVRSPTNFGFNGAAPLRARKQRLRRAADAHPEASMGPRPCGRGNFLSLANVSSSYPCFNGAAPLRARKPSMVMARFRSSQSLQWGRALAGAETPPPLDSPLPTYARFNGAAPLRARKPDWNLRE